MKKTLFIMALVCGISIVNAQKNVEEQQFKVNMLMPGLGYEIGVDTNATLAFGISTGFGFRGCTDCNTEFGVYPIFSGQYNYYYNFERRQEKGKNISGNTGNYIARWKSYYWGFRFSI